MVLFHEPCNGGPRAVNVPNGKREKHFGHGGDGDEWKKTNYGSGSGDLDRCCDEKR